MAHLKKHSYLIQKVSANFSLIKLGNACAAILYASVFQPFEVQGTLQDFKKLAAAAAP
jgi:hypothetical protein